MASVHFSSQVVNVDVDDVRHGIEIQLPDLFDDRGAGNGLTRVAHEVFEQSVFLRAEFDRLARPLNRVGKAIKLQIFDL